jgi:hypothetical protein
VVERAVAEKGGLGAMGIQLTDLAVVELNRADDLRWLLKSHVK